MVNTENDIRILNQREYILFKKIYQLKCLNLNQAFDFLYKHEYSFRDFFYKIIIPLRKEKLIELKNYTTNNFAIFLTNLGINAIKLYEDKPTEVYDSKENKILKTYLTAKDLDLNPKLIKHQLNLNQFVLDFEDYYKKINGKDIYGKLDYYDEKFVSRFTRIRPDGMFQIGNLLLFIEQDMGTESSAQLNNKWNNYRLFLENHKDEYVDSKIVCLFIVKCDKTMLNNRMNLIRKTTSSVFTQMIDDNFDIYIGDKDYILNACFSKIIPQYFKQYKTIEDKILVPLINKKGGFTISRGEKLSLKVGGSKYGYYIRKVNNGIIESHNGRVQEFLFDEYYFSPLSVLSKIQFIARTNSLFKIKFQRNIDYLILVENPKEMYEHLKSIDELANKKVYYTTPKRLAERPFYNALFQFDNKGNIYSCIDETYQAIKLESNVYD